LLVTAVGRVSDIKHARTQDFKSVGDVIYLLRAARAGLPGSELALEYADRLGARGFTESSEPGRADWKAARPLYSWLGGARGILQPKLKSVHDLSDGGLLVAVAEACLARGLGAEIEIPEDEENPWEFSFGEGFHGFIASVSPDDAQAFEREWSGAGVPFKGIGVVSNQERLSVKHGTSPRFHVSVGQLRLAWLKEGYWE
jgi:phosphoribosylformylglycinamidine synthase